jgi:hypothetical protein
MVYLQKRQVMCSTRLAGCRPANRSTYGGRKNCSSDTYMPRNISMSKKYLPARSNAPSPSSHRFGLGNRKPGGGGPAGVAARERVVENKATVAGEGRRPDAKCGDRSSVAAGRVRANIVNGFALAIVSVVESLAGWGGCWRIWRLSSSSKLEVVACNAEAAIGRHVQ